MQSVEFGELKKLDDTLKDILDSVPGARRQLHKKIADVIKKEVDTQINASGLNDSRGKIKDWQETTVGSGGGYAAGHAVKGETGANSPGAITNYLENGHRIREPSEKSKNYKPRIKKPYVDGYHFYQSASNKVEAKAITEAEQFVEDLRKKLEGENG